MDRRRFLASLAAAGGARAAVKPLNFVFILIDDFGWKDTGYNGSTYYETPNIDRLASQGMRFTNGYSACPVCSPTRSAIMTGKYPARLGITSHLPGNSLVFPYAPLRSPEVVQQLPHEETTIAEVLKGGRYATASIGKWHMGGDGFGPTTQGFDLNFAGTLRGSPRSFFYPQWGDNPPVTAPDGTYLTDLLTDKAVEFIRGSAGKPFFLYLPHYATHIPIHAKKELIDKFARKSDPSQPQNYADYAAMIQSVDESVGRIMKAVEESGSGGNTVFFFTADNGGVTSLEWRNRPVTSNLPLRAGKGHLYEGGIRVPALVKWPGVTRPGSSCDEPISSIDYHPTIAEIAGMPQTPGIDGRSLVRLLRGGRMPERDLFWHYPHYSPQLGRPGAVIRRGDWKLIRFYEDDHHELYNLAQDIAEKNDLASRETRRAGEMRGRLDAWLAASGARMMTRNPQHDPARPYERPGYAPRQN